MAPSLSIVIPVFNNWKLTRDCLLSLREHTTGDDFEVIVVDNASSDDTPAELPSLGETLFPGRFICLRFSENRNFGPACNAGATAATAPLVFFLNNDTLMTPQWSEPLLAAMNAADAPGAVGPLLLYPDDTVQHLGVTITPSGVDHLYKGIAAEHPVVGKKRPLQCLTGAALLTSRSTFLSVGGFHEGYRNGCEDLELTARIREQGRTLLCIAASRVYHLESQTPGRMDKEKDNFRLLFERCGDLLAIDIHLHARQDGFEARLDDWDNLSVVVTPEGSSRLVSSIDSQDTQAVSALLRRNPYWLEGAALLRDVLDRNGLPNQALAAAYKVLEIFPNVADSKKAMALAVKAGSDKDVEGCGTLLRALLLRQKDQENRTDRLGRILQRARLHNDDFLERLYAERLRSVRTGV